MRAQNLLSDWLLDGAQPYRSRREFDVLEENFGNRILALGYLEASGIRLDWPPHSPDLNSCDSFSLGGYINDKEYSNNPKIITERKTATQEVIHSLNVRQNFAIRLHHIIANDGRHAEHVIL
ncbi:uncharacterized protein TNCV_4447761 [Trichonephila clavipes]|nr:uncharacterized protein TNCV_4447761 [Trichonephila clavipes]